MTQDSQSEYTTYLAMVIVSGMDRHMIQVEFIPGALLELCGMRTLLILDFLDSICLKNNAITREKRHKLRIHSKLFMFCVLLPLCSQKLYLFIRLSSVVTLWRNVSVSFPPPSWSAMSYLLIPIAPCALPYNSIVTYFVLLSAPPLPLSLGIFLMVVTQPY